MQIYKDDIISIEFIEEQKYMLVTRYPFEDVDDYKQSVLKWLEYVKENRPTAIIVDESRHEFTFSPAMQMWINSNLIEPGVKVGVRKVALVQNEDLFVQTSLEQLLEEDASKPLNIAYFSSVDDAKKWILS